MHDIPRALRRLAAALAAALLLASPALAEQKRLALILANEDYPSNIGRLTQAHNDAAEVESALRQVGFAVTKRLDRNSAETQTDLAAFLAAVDAEAEDGDDVVVFFYAAMHGVVADTIEGQRNFLVPAREQIASPVELLNRGVRVDAVINGLAMTKAKAVIVVSDACRNSSTAFSRSGVRGFVPVTAGANMMIAYATEAGATTPDDGAFARVLAREIVASGRKANYAMADVVGSVGRERAVNSRPYTTGSLPDWFCFNGCTPSAIAAAVPVSATVAAPPPLPAAFDLAALHPDVARAVSEARAARTAGEAANTSACGSSDPSASAAFAFGAILGAGPARDPKCKDGLLAPPSRGAFIGKTMNRAYETYAGNFLNGKPNGAGSHRWLNGESYEGQWKAGKREGLGVVWSKDGQAISAGRWKGDRPVEVLIR